MASKKFLLGLMVLLLVSIIGSGATQSATIISLNRGENVVLGSEIEGVFTVPVIIDGKGDLIFLIIEYCPDAVVFVGLWPIGIDGWSVEESCGRGLGKRGEGRVPFELLYHRHPREYPFKEMVMVKLYFLPLPLTLEERKHSFVNIHHRSSVVCLRTGQVIERVLLKWTNLVFPEPEE